jgi:type IV pilus assembly protein PilV
MSVTSRRAQPCRGFTKIEILVTLVILMIGLLGIAGLMAQGQRSSFEAYQRQQALMLANDMAERIKANRAGADDTEVASTYDVAVPVGDPAGTGARYDNLLKGVVTNCVTTSGTCTTSQVVMFDAALWDGLLVGQAAETQRATGTALGPLLSPRGCVQTLSTTACPACGGPPASRQVIYRVSVAWQGNYSTAAPAGGDTCGTGVYRNPADNSVDENFRRLVSVDVYTVLPCACP